MILKGGIQIRCTKGFLKKMTLKQKQKAAKMLNNINQGESRRRLWYQKCKEV